MIVYGHGCAPIGAKRSGRPTSPTWPTQNPIFSSTTGWPLAKSDSNPTQWRDVKVLPGGQDAIGLEEAISLMACQISSLLVRQQSFAAKLVIGGAMTICVQPSIYLLSSETPVTSHLYGRQLALLRPGIHGSWLEL